MSGADIELGVPPVRCVQHSEKESYARFWHLPSASSALPLAVKQTIPQTTPLTLSALPVLLPEMSYSTIGYRIDTLLGHFSNSNLMHGNDEEAYHEFIEGLKGKENKFVVATPKDFNKKITVSKLRNFVQQYKLDALFIDGIKYLSDERGRKNDNLTTSLTNISEDLMELSVELEIPVIAVVQANRGGVSDANEDDTPELETIRDSDGIAHNASRVISLKLPAEWLRCCR